MPTLSSTRAVTRRAVSPRSRENQPSVLLFITVSGGSVPGDGALDGGVEGGVVLGGPDLRHAIRADSDASLAGRGPVAAAVADLPLARGALARIPHRLLILDLRVRPHDRGD